MIFQINVWKNTKFTQILVSHAKPEAFFKEFFFVEPNILRIGSVYLGLLYLFRDTQHSVQESDDCVFDRSFHTKYRKH